MAHFRPPTTQMNNCSTINAIKKINRDLASKQLNMIYLVLTDAVNLYLFYFPEANSISQISSVPGILFNSISRTLIKDYSDIEKFVNNSLIP